MLLECEYCGAPLNVKDGAWVVTCSYCQRMQRVKGKAHAVPTPHDWQAPAQWTPPPAAKVPGDVLNFDPLAAVRHTTQRVALAILIPMLLIIAISLASASVPLIEGFFWDGSETFVCETNGEKTIRGIKVNASARPAISVHGNCHLTIQSSRIRGDQVFEIGFNAHVTVKDSEVTTKGTLSLDGHIKLVESKLHVESDEETFVVIESNSGSVVLDGSELTVQAGKDAVVIVATGGPNGLVELSNSKVSIAGGTRLVLLRRPTPLRWHGGSFDAGGRLLEVDGPHIVADVDLQGSELVY